MLNLIGSVSIAAALLGALAATLTGIIGGFTRKPTLIRAARYSTYFVFFAMSAAFIAMEVALLTHDFSVKYVARVGSLETPTYYTAISLWSSLEGSILFWGWILAAYGALVAFVNRKSDSRLIPFAGPASKP